MCIRRRRPTRSGSNGGEPPACPVLAMPPDFWCGSDGLHLRFGMAEQVNLRCTLLTSLDSLAQLVMLGNVLQEQWLKIAEAHQETGNVVHTSGITFL
jgi:hypothetical protein